MATMTFSGTGILSGEWNTDEIARQRAQHDQECEEDLKRESEIAAWESDQQKLRDAIDAAIFPHLKAELEAENATQRVSAADRQRFKDFQACCERWGFPALPAPPQAVAVFLAEKSEEDAAAHRLARSISVVHRALNFSDPTEDVLIRAMIRQARTEANNQKGE